jgi:hypothetical protein
MQALTSEILLDLEDLQRPKSWYHLDPDPATLAANYSSRWIDAVTLAQTLVGCTFGPEEAVGVLYSGILKVNRVSAGVEETSSVPPCARAISAAM